jgi:capsid protein
MNSLLVVNNGRKLAQLKAEHPGTTYEMFHREKLREAARCLNMPYNVAAGDSSRYNYASGRLDHQTYDRSLKIEQDYFGSACLDRTFLRWLEEAMLIPGYLPEGLPPFAEWNWLWFFDGRPHVDPLKEAAAAVTLRDACYQSEKAYFAERGLDWEEQEKQIATELGLTVPEIRKLKALKRFSGANGLSEAVLRILDEEAAQEAADEREAADAA